MTDAPTYREHARAALRMAETAGADGRQCLISLAKIWFSLADKLERGRPLATKLSQVKRQHERKAEGEKTSR